MFEMDSIAKKGKSVYACDLNSILNVSDIADILKVPLSNPYENDFAKQCSI